MAGSQGGLLTMVLGGGQVPGGSAKGRESGRMARAEGAVQARTSSKASVRQDGIWSRVRKGELGARAKGRCSCRGRA